MKVAKSLWDGLLAIAVYNDSFYYVKNIHYFFPYASIRHVCSLLTLS